MTQKRERSINFTREEIELLINLVAEKKYIIENKKSDAETWHEKEKCWKEIEISFNCASGSCTYRTGKNLRLKYEGIKREIRKKSSVIRAETYRTGGGPSTPSTASTLSNYEIKVKDMILLSDLVTTEESLPPEKLECNFSENCSIDLINDQNDDCSRSNSNNDVSPDDVIDNSVETPVHPLKRKLSEPKLFEKVAESRLEIAKLQKIILEKELLNKRAQWNSEEEERKQHQRTWDFEEEERNRKREIWKLQKKFMLKKINDISYIILLFHNTFYCKGAK